MPVYIPQELVEYYQCHSLKESFKQLDTTLKYPYKARERTASRASSRSPGNASSGRLPADLTEARAPSRFPPLGVVAQVPQLFASTVPSQGARAAPCDQSGVPALNWRPAWGGSQAGPFCPQIHPCAPAPSPAPSQGPWLPGSRSWDLDLGTGLPGTDGAQLERRARWGWGQVLEPPCFVPLQGPVEPQAPRPGQSRPERKPGLQ